MDDLFTNPLHLYIQALPVAIPRLNKSKSTFFCGNVSSPMDLNFEWYCAQGALPKW